jgi:tRNA(fMet)-specific endonuclease VapC
VIVLPYDSQVNKIAIDIFRKLKRINKLLDAPDLFIAASAIANEMQLATLNKKHFSRIKGLKLVHDKNWKEKWRTLQ